jgi:hypothetical protein
MPSRLKRTSDLAQHDFDEGIFDVSGDPRQIRIGRVPLDYRCEVAEQGCLTVPG